MKDVDVAIFGNGNVLSNFKVVQKVFLIASCPLVNNADEKGFDLHFHGLQSTVENIRSISL